MKEAKTYDANGVREANKDNRAPYNPSPDRGLLEDLKASPSRVKDRVRLQAQRDRYFLAKGILGYQDVNEYTHGPLCRALEDKTQHRRMYLMHRGSLKTTVATITDSIGGALADPLHYTCLIINEIIENAQNFLAEIKSHFQTNELLHELFPELIPEKFGGPGSRWGTSRACLRREGSTEREFTWTVIGVGGAIVSRHFKHIKCDDLIGFDAYTSPAAMAYAIKYTKGLESLLTNMEEDFIDFVGTRWAIYDLYREILNLYGDDMAYFAREDIERVPFEVSDDLLRSAHFRAANLDEIRGTDQPIFPKKFSLKMLRRMEQIDPVLYFAQYKNNPIAEGISDFQVAKLNWFDFDRWGNVVYRDPTSGLYLRWRLEELDIVMTCDPNSGEMTAQDLPAIGIYGFSPKDQMFTLETWSKRVPPDAYVEQIYDMWKIWQPRGCRACGIEKAGQQTTAFYFKKLARDRKQSINVVELKPKNRDKAIRIRKQLQPIINLGNFFLRKDQTSLRHQIRFHPNLNNDDELDCAAYATEITTKPYTSEEREDEEKMISRIQQSRSPLTGYGR
jgi:hypothetical protein